MSRATCVCPTYLISPLQTKRLPSRLPEAGGCIVFGVEFREGLAVVAAAGLGQRVLRFLRRERAGRKSGQPVVDIESPIAALGEFAVADDVDSGLDLLAHHLVDRVLQTGLVGGRVVAFAGFDLAQMLDRASAGGSGCRHGWRVCGRDARTCVPPGAFSDLGETMPQRPPAFHHSSMLSSAAVIRLSSGCLAQYSADLDPVLFHLVEVDDGGGSPRRCNSPASTS